MAIGTVGIKRLIWLLVAFICFAVIKAQDRSIIQLKALDHQLKPYPGLSIALNNGKASQVDGQGISYVEVNSGDLPPKTVSILNPKLEVESWNFSQGILEVVVRPKTYIQITAILQDQRDQPISGVTVIYNTKEPITATSDQRGIINMNLPLGHDPNKTNLFQVKGYQLVEKEFKENQGTLTLIPIPKVATSKTVESATNLTSQTPETENIQNFEAFNFAYLDSIQSLTVFYAVIKNVNVAQFDEQLKRKVDEKFYQLVGKWEDSLQSIREQQFMGSISDSSLVKTDVALLIEQALAEQESLTQIRNQFDENVVLLEEKLAGGGTNLSNEEQLLILEGINKLSLILGENEKKFYQNQARFNNLLNVLKGRLTSIDELEEKLLLSEQQLEIQSKDFAKKLLTAIAIALALALFGAISLVLTKKFQKQRNQLTKANAEVKRVNEHLEELVSERTAQLQETNQELDTFLYKSSHDLRRPLTSIVGLSNIAEMTLQGEAFELFERAASTARGMDRMLRKLINVNEINNPSQYSPVDFSGQVQKIIKGFEDIITEQRIRVESNIQPDIAYRSYPDLIEIILQNLVENALFFSTVKGTGHRPMVRVNVIQQNGHVLINLEDNGCGVDAAVKDKIWNMFFVGHEKSTGNGLGLYITRKAVKALNGEVACTTNGAGETVFEVCLPVNGSS